MNLIYKYIGVRGMFGKFILFDIFEKSLINDGLLTSERDIRFSINLECGSEDLSKREMFGDQIPSNITR